jgi:alkylhydroperoxidase family enzyme
VADSRIAPLELGDWDAGQQALVDRHIGDGTVTNISRTVLRYGELFDRWYPFMDLLLNHGALPPIDRELVILRTAHRRNSAYQWDRHSRLCLSTGLEPADVERVAEGPEAEGWSDWWRTLLRAVDQVIDVGRIADPEWAALAECYDERQLMELVFVVGHYWLLAAVLSSLDTPL